MAIDYFGGTWFYIHTGNNYFGDDIKEKLLELKDSEERAAYILMDMIVPPTQESVIVYHDSYSHLRISNELGIYGVFVKWVIMLLLIITISSITLWVVIFMGC